MSGVDREYENMLLSSWDKPNEQVSHVIYKERKVGKHVGKRVHTREAHEYHMKRWGHCVYCDNGYVVGTREEIVEAVDK